MKNIWITWEDHRRSRELAESFDAEYIFVKSPKNRLAKYIYSTVLTLYLIARKSPDNVFCQNPSVMLAYVVVLMKKFFRYKAIVDRHSNFKIDKLDDGSLKWRIFHYLSNYSLSNADITIVTNGYAKDYISSLARSVAILPDRIPKIECKACSEKFEVDVAKKKKVLFVTTFDDDEPINEMLEAAKSLDSVNVYLTGNYKKKFSESEVIEFKRHDIIFTGFVPNSVYETLLCESDLVVVLTDKDLILNCGAYEALSLNKPLILSNTKTLKSYFGGPGIIYVNNSRLDILGGINEALPSLDVMKSNIVERRKEIDKDWQSKKDDLMSLIHH